MKLLLTLGVAAFLTAEARAQFDGARLYWPLPQNTNIFALRTVDAQANASLSAWNQIQPDVDIESQLYALTYTRVQPVFGRTAYWQAILPAATIDTASTLPLGAGDEFANGIGDPVVQATINVFGKPGMLAKEYLRHDQGTSLDLGLSISVPLGTYDSDRLLNTGSNQWKFRASAPIVHAFGPWTPGERTTLEVTPALHVFTDNDNALGNRIEQDPLLSLEAHLTRDLTRDTFLSLDYTLLDGGDETVSDRSSGALVRETSGIDSQLLGFTVGFEINDSLRLTLSHMQTLGGRSSDAEFDGSLTMITLSWAWHSVLENVRQFHKD